MLLYLLLQLILPTPLKEPGSFSTQKIKGALLDAVDNVLFRYAGENDFDSLAARFNTLSFGNSKLMIVRPFANYLKRVNNPVNFRKGIDMIVGFRDSMPEHYRKQFDPYFNGMILNGIACS